MVKFLNTDETKQKIEKRIQDLKAELASLTKHQNWSDFNFDVGDVAETIKDKGHQALEIVNEQAHNLTGQAKRNPKTTLAIIGALGVAAYFLLRRK